MATAFTQTRRAKSRAGALNPKRHHQIKSDYVVSYQSAADDDFFAIALTDDTARTEINMTRTEADRLFASMAKFLNVKY